MNRISVITICFNNLEELKRTCESVDIQELEPFEHVIIDGSMKPDIKNFLEQTPQPPYRVWISERDKGISDAFNKGVKKATGDIVVMLNSADTLYDKTVLEKVTAVFNEDPSVQWCHGKQYLLRGDKWVFIGKPFDKDKLYRGMRGTFHQTMYVRKELHDKYGLYDIDVKYVMDYDFLCRIANEKFVFIDYPLATFDPTGISTTQYLKAMREIRVQYSKYYGTSLKQTMWGWRLKVLHHLLNSSFGKFLYRVKVKLGAENV